LIVYLPAVADGEDRDAFILKHIDDPPVSPPIPGPLLIGGKRVRRLTADRRFQLAIVTYGREGQSAWPAS